MRRSLIAWLLVLFAGGTSAGAQDDLTEIGQWTQYFVTGALSVRLYEDADYPQVLVLEVENSTTEDLCVRGYGPMMMASIRFQGPGAEVLRYIGPERLIRAPMGIYPLAPGEEISVGLDFNTISGIEPGATYYGQIDYPIMDCVFEEGELVRTAPRFEGKFSPQVTINFAYRR